MKVGDKVVCISGVNSLEKGNIYIIKSFSNCCISNISVGLATTNSLGSMCYDCNTSHGDRFTAFFKLSRFRKVEPFRNELTKTLMVEVLTEQLKPQIERIEIKEKETA